MKQLLFGLGPLAALAAWLGLAAWQVQGHIIDVDGLAWGDAAGRLTAHRESSRAPSDPETENLLLRITDAGGGEVHREAVSISWDLWGWGLVAAMQVDADPELEIVFIDASSRRGRNLDGRSSAFYLDLSSGRVERKPLTSATQDVLPVIDEWAALHKPLTAVLLLALYYLVFYLPFQVIRLLVGVGARWRKMRSSVEATSGPSSEPGDRRDG